MDGITLQEGEQSLLVLIENLSEEFKSEIVRQLSGVFHGLAETQELPDTFTFSFTVESFLDRYNSKSEDIKKGMIGELLTHVLINHYLDEFKTLSILKNKEERSIKKGFDIIYYDTVTSAIWYSEVKSGEPTTDDERATEYNDTLLVRARNGIKDMFMSQRKSLWESALIDVKLTIEEGEERLSIRQLLAEELNVVEEEEMKNVVLVSVLYHNSDDPISFSSIEDFRKETVAQNIFKSSIVISIQKSTYEAVQIFLEEQSQLKYEG